MRNLCGYILIISFIYLCMGVTLAMIFEPFPVYNAWELRQ